MTAMVAPNTGSSKPLTLVSDASPASRPNTSHGPARYSPRKATTNAQSAAPVNAVINAFRMVDHIVVMTRGGPDNATSLLLYYIYEIGFRFWDTGYAAALTMVLLAILGAAALAQFWFVERKVHYQ